MNCSEWDNVRNEILPWYKYNFILHFYNAILHYSLVEAHLRCVRNWLGTNMLPYRELL